MRMILGLDDLRAGPILDRARALQAPVLVSANRLAVRRKDASGIPVFHGFTTAPLACLAGMECHLDSAGFVAMEKYRGFEWAVEEYVGLGAAFPWRWFASMDACVEPEVAPDREAVQDRVAWTVALNRACRREAEAQGCADRLMPVIQGARAEDYLRCLDRMPEAAEAPILGVGSMCRRQTGGLDGILACVDAIDRALGVAPARLHLFGAKSDATEALRAHPRVASADSQAYGVRARSIAVQERRRAEAQPDLLGPVEPFSKSGAFVAGVMGAWYGKQRARVARRGSRPAATARLDLPVRPAPADPWEAKLARARDEMRDLLAEGEMDWPQMNERWAWEWAGDLETA